MELVCERHAGRWFRLWSLGLRYQNRFYWFRVAWKAPKRLSDPKAALWEVSVSTVWEPRDLWVGLYHTSGGYGRWLFYLCLIPMLPLRIHVKRNFGTGGVA